MNDHITVNRIDPLIAQKYNIAKYDNMVKFSQWLTAQSIKFENATQALKVYRNEEISTIQISPAPKCTKKSFKNRQQLNSFLRSNGYKWHKLAPMNEYEESKYGESDRWALLDSSGHEYTVNEALAKI